MTVVLAGYSGLLNHLQLASHDLADYNNNPRLASDYKLGLIAGLP